MIVIDWSTFVLTLVKYLPMICWNMLQSKSGCFFKHSVSEIFFKNRNTSLHYLVKYDISQDSAATCFKCDGIFNGRFIANLPLLLAVQIF